MIKYDAISEGDNIDEILSPLTYWIITTSHDMIYAAYLL